MEQDFPAALVAIIFIAYLLEQTGADPDVRPAGRPVEFREGNLLIRAGRVELWALTSWLRDRERALASAGEVACRALEARSRSEPFADSTYWWPRLDPTADIVYLWTNAGWYAQPENAAAVFEAWARRYQAALEAGHLFVECAEDLQRVATLLPGLRNKPLHDWDELEFLKFLDGKRVVFASAFAGEIQSHFASGELAKLWADAGHPISLDKLETVLAPMSVWPYMPDKDWLESFGKFEAACLDAIDRIEADVFLASCGAYGLPITHSMHCSRRLTAIYNGHATNCYFGIYTNDCRGRDLHRYAPNSRYWRRVDLGERFGELKAIDEGRYVCS
jgi:hypothetical protein